MNITLLIRIRVKVATGDAMIPSVAGCQPRNAQRVAALRDARARPAPRQGAPFFCVLHVLPREMVLFLLYNI